MKIIEYKSHTKIVYDKLNILFWPSLMYLYGIAIYNAIMLVCLWLYCDCCMVNSITGQDMAYSRYGRISHRQDVYNLRLKNGNNKKLSESYNGDTRRRLNQVSFQMNIFQGKKLGFCKSALTAIIFVNLMRTESKLLQYVVHLVYVNV